MQNPYVLAAVRKQQTDRAMRLPSAQADTFPVGTAPADFFEGLGAGGPRANMIRNIQCSAAARRMTAEEIAATRAYLIGQREKEAQRYRDLGAPACIVENFLRPTVADQVLNRECKRRGL